MLPEPPREFRGVWVATVDNINWPSRPGLPVEQQKRELRGLIQAAARARCNAIIFQIRPACDALYASPYEPWSEYLTGAIGRAPRPGWDPLALAVQEAHACGLELHAWINPFRARHRTNRTPPAANHVMRRRADWVRAYGEEQWLDPGEPEARSHVLAVVRDVVRRYDVDGLHMDDYFYPYPIKGAGQRVVDFPDDASWRRHGEGRGWSSRADWRRANVDTFVQQLYATVKAEKPWVKVGISPFGIWRPGHPRGVVGLDAYGVLYADARRWLREGWLDYVSPQLYWRRDAPGQRFDDLLAWWAEQNALGRHVWPGLNASRVIEVGERSWPAGEILGQIASVRRQAGASGQALYHARAALDPGGLGRALTRAYDGLALVPQTPWLRSSSAAAQAPRLVLRDDGRETRVEWSPLGERPRFWLARCRRAGRWSAYVVGGDRSVLPLGGGSPVDLVAVCAIDGSGGLGAVAVAP